MAHDHPMNLTVGRCTLPWDGQAEGWALPGGNYVYNRVRAEELARRIDRDMRITPHRYSARAAQASTNNSGGMRK